MTDKTTVARPYAKAAFEEAREEKALGAWSDALHNAATAAQDPRVHRLLGNPAVSADQLGQLFLDVAGPSLDEHGRNFILTLVQNRRLAYLPEISALFDELKDAAEGVVDVTVTSAAALDERQRETLTTALKRKLNREVRLHCDTDASLLGGAVLRAGDLVIDGSMRSRLDRIAYELTA